MLPLGDLRDVLPAVTRAPPVLFFSSFPARRNPRFALVQISLDELTPTEDRGISSGFPQLTGAETASEVDPDVVSNGLLDSPEIGL